MRKESIATEADVHRAYRRYGQELLGYAMSALGDRHLAEEIVQEAFVQAWRSSADFDPVKGSLRTWLYRIVRNRVVDAARRRAARPPVVDRLGRATDTAAPDEFDRLLTGIQLDEALRRLTPEHRHVVTEVYYRGRTCAELGHELGLPASTLRSRLYYAVRTLRTAIEETGGLVR